MTGQARIKSMSLTVWGAIVSFLLLTAGLIY